MLRYILFACLICSIRADIVFTTCARMDVFFLDKVARALCITSCSIQNCGTGYCERRDGRPTCVCSRCANGGGDIPLDLLKKGRK